MTIRPNCIITIYKFSIFKPNVEQSSKINSKIVLSEQLDVFQVQLKYALRILFKSFMAVVLFTVKNY